MTRNDKYTTGKAYADKLMAYVKEQGKPNHKHWVELLAIQDEIEYAVLESGLPLKLIWHHKKEVEQQINCSYEYFRRFVKKQIIGQSVSTDKSINNTKTRQAEVAKEQSTANKPHEPLIINPKQRTFFHNPTPNLEDLI